MCSVFSLSIAALIWATQVSAATSAPEPQDPQHLAEWRQCIADSGSQYDAGRFTEAARLLEKAVHHAEHFPALDPRLPTTIHALAFVYQEQGRYPEATSMYLRAIHLWEKIGPAQGAALLRSTDNLIGTYVEARNYGAAKKLLTARLPEMERTAATWKERATLLDTRSGLAFIERDYREAERLLRESLALWEQHAADEDSNMAVVLMNLAHALASDKRYQEALDMALRAVATLDKLDPTAGSLIVRTLDYAGLLCAKLQRPADAEPYYRRALAAARQVYGPEDVVSGQIMLRYSAVLRSLQRSTEAKRMASEARAVLERSSQKRDAVDILNLAPVR